jgi:hypothetical protein
MQTLNRYGELHAILAIDPGGTTGVFAGYIETKPTLKETLETLYNEKDAEVSGNYLEQGQKLSKIMSTFEYRANVENGIELDNIHFAIEDFVLRRRREGGATGNLTSCWVAAAATAIYQEASMDGEMYPNLAWQTPSDAKSRVTNDRLRMYDMYVPGSEHKKDARRHFVLRADRILG